MLWENLCLGYLSFYQSYYTAFKKVADRGFKIHISELDIVINEPLGLKSKPNAQDLEMQKTFYETILKAYIDAVPPHLRYGITVWGLLISIVGLKPLHLGL